MYDHLLSSIKRVQMKSLDLSLFIASVSGLSHPLSLFIILPDPTDNATDFSLHVGPFISCHIPYSLQISKSLNPSALRFKRSKFKSPHIIDSKSRHCKYILIFCNSSKKCNFRSFRMIIQNHQHN